LARIASTIRRRTAGAIWRRYRSHATIWGLVAVGGKLYAVGGRFNTFEYNTNFVDVYAAAVNSWSSRKLMPAARSDSAVAVLDGKIFVFGSQRLGGTFNQAEAYDPVADVCAELAPMPMSVHGTGAVTIGDTIYIPGGGTLNGGTAQTNGNQSFTLKQALNCQGYRTKACEASEQAKRFSTSDSVDWAPRGGLL
jgi:hypothetical protein